ncbi:MAG: sensor histidine kinase [Dysgonomonas sp.]
MYLKYILFIILFSSSTILCQAQDGGKKKSQKNAAQSVVNAIEEGKSDEEVAASYEKLAKELSDKKDYARAEDYLKRAKALYEKLKDKDKIAYIDRELAKAQEAQNKVGEAILSFNNARMSTSSSTFRKLNTNDMDRLSNKNNPQSQSYYFKQNAELLEGKVSGINASYDLSAEKAQVYQQMAQVNKEMDNTPAAIENLGKALVTVKDKPLEAFEIKKDIANTLAADNQLDKAIALNKELVADAQKTSDTKAEIQQLQALSSNLLDANKKGEAISTLKKAYDLAVNKGQTLEARNSLELLVSQYRADKNTQKALEAYSDFMDRLETLVKSDSTLVDEKVFQVQEEKISQLEKERTLKDALINKTNTFNYVLLGTIILILIFLAFIARALYSIKKKNKRIALQSLRREMNPHFIFNSLNSVNQFIAQNNELEANKYLSSYSKLMRNIMENSNKDFISLSTELEQMKEYLDLEHMRFQDKFNYEIKVDDTIDCDATLIPNMLIQPQLENAIWHGLRYKDEMGQLSLSVKIMENKLIVSIEDDGIGLKKSQELKTKHQRQHHSRGLTNTNERISLLNSLYSTNISIDITEKEEPKTGVVVILQFPLIDKNILSK